ncbi:hypothetical protein LTR84_006911 [Exophiala bonariae]|uniref:Guanylate cyclase domain-containing protein n=1 Tax=Exophiala bonariae TaxID=1690606 RepID=A0AAV9N0A2_9EURO|nr:hypothetical protein LTR84_006911 [Exophiala bonariae]
MPGIWIRRVSGVRVRVRGRADVLNTTTGPTTEPVRTLSVSSTFGGRVFLPPSSVRVQQNRAASEHRQDKLVARSCILLKSHSSTISNIEVVRKLSTVSPVREESRSMARDDETATSANLDVSSGADIQKQSSISTGAKEEVLSDDPITPPDGALSIVFTDIVKSTAIWEANPSAMVAAMQTHDNMVRELIASNSGYEVKQNGDGFMIAFPSATSAVQFCLDVQERLLDESWPTAILKSNPGRETTDADGHVLFRGLKLRMSAHWGRPVCNWNEVIHRMDYLGPMVNRAARFIEVTEGGQVVVSEDFLLQLQCELESTVEVDNQEEPKEILEDSERTGVDQKPRTELNLDLLSSNRDQLRLTHQAFQLRLLGDHEFKGLTEPEKLYFIVPKSLEGRVDHWHQVMHIAGVKGNVRTTTKD